MCVATHHAGLLVTPILFGLPVLADALGMEGHAPATAPHAAIAFDQRSKGRPIGLIQRSHSKSGHCISPG
jgi:hypothetical protein